MVETTYHLDIPISLALLGDLHGRDPAPVLSGLTAHRPSVIAIAGDILYGSHPANDRSPLDTQENVLPFLSACSSIAPTFLSLGNHEWMLDAADLNSIRGTGVTVLDNEWQELVIDGKTILLGGLTSAYVLDYRRFLTELDEPERACLRYPKEETARESERHGKRTETDKYTPDISWLDAFTGTPGYHILLCHHPEYWPLVREYDVNLCLSAHAHGGQWRFYHPIRRTWQGVWSPGQGLFPRWTRGVYEDRLVVSAGLANTASVPRFFNPTEMVFVEP